MSEAPVRPELAEAQARLLAWRREGVWRADPMRFHRMEALARRLAVQDEPMQQRLAPRLGALLEDYAQRVAQARQAVAEEGVSLVAAQPALLRPLKALQATGDHRGLRRLAARSASGEGHALAALNIHLQSVSPTVRGAEPAEVAAGREELFSVRAFRRVWGRRQSLDRLAQARARQPAKAGPLNSHVLVLQSLALMQALSPDYLRHFLGHVESLQWLEQAREAWASAPSAVAPGKPAKAPRRKGKKSS